MSILVVLGAWLLHMSWQKWVNLTVDYGRELYTPWRIACGGVLYKDIASLFGPFPPYWNALLFKTFGVSIMTLVLFNILLVIGITVLIYRFFSYTTEKQAALFASAAFLIIFAFQQNNGNGGIHAYICPYTYSVTYAVFFSLWAIDLFRVYQQTGKDYLAGAIGVLIGLAALCRFEIFIFLAIAIILGFLSKGIVRKWPLLLGGFCVPVGIAGLYFSTQLPLAQVWPDIFGFNGKWLEILKTDYYQVTAGLDHPWHNFMIMLAAVACYGLVIIAFKCLCMGADRLETGKRWQGVVFVLLGMAGMAGIAIWILRFTYDGIFRGLPAVMIFMVGYLFWRRSLPLLVMGAWGLLMLTKVFLNVQIDSEGFVYAMPGVILFIVFFISFVPRYFEHPRKRAPFVRALVCVLAVLIFITGLRLTDFFYQSRNFQIRAGRDIIISDVLTRPEIGEMSLFLKDADKIMGRGTDFVAFPQGVMLNFLTKRVNPLPYIVFQQVELMSFPRQEILRSFKEHKPDYVILTDQSPENESEASHTIRAWILANYHPVWPPPHSIIGNAITVLQRS